jgi:heat shock transcription factor, other eukaryote
LRPNSYGFRSFLDQSKNTDLIRWSDSGDSFIVLDEDEFAKTLIPELFKHNNYASFVRQLNMYGFHKKVGLSDNSMKASERKNKSPSEYHNPYFKRGHPDLLWLINKPKISQASNRDGKKTGRKGAVKTEEGDRGSDDDGSGDDNDEFSKGHSGQHDVPRIAGSGGGGAGGGGGRGLIAPSDGGGIVAKRELADVRSQLESIRQHQKVISTHINRLRKDHAQLYEQAVAFQTLHDRHESSINAILTFLATVYNRSLESHGGQNFASMFGNAIPHDTQGQGNVVDVGDVAEQGSDNQVQRRFRRQPLLITAPPSSGEPGRVSTTSPSASGSSAQAFQPLFGQSQQPQYPQPNQTQTPTQSGAIEELFDLRSAGASPAIKPDVDAQSSPPDMPQRDILSIINSANATNNIQGVRYDFPSALSHYETSNGNSPLTPKQRNAMLHLIANNTNASATGTNNALLSPTPPPVPSLDQFDNTQQDIDMLARLQAEQDAKVQNLANMVQPLSPTGEIPGLTDGQYYNGQGLDGTGALDLDQIFNSGDYFSNHGNGDMDFVNDVGLGDNVNIFDGTADGGNSGMNNDDANRIVETLDSSESTSPSNTVEDGTSEEVGSPSKRRKRG